MQRRLSSFPDELTFSLLPAPQLLNPFALLPPQNAEFARTNPFFSPKQPRPTSSFAGASGRQIVHQPHQPAIQGTAATYASLLRCCAKAKALADGKRVHSLMIASGLEQGLLIGSLLVQMYGSCGAYGDAIVWFANMHHRQVYSWNAIIRIYAQQEQNQETSRCFQQMQQEGVLPNKVTFICVLSSCASQAAFKEGCRLHARTMNSEFESNVIGVTALVNFYGKCGRLQDAQKAFDNLPERDVALWNCMIAVHSQHDEGNEAVHHFNQMQQEGVIPDKVTLITMLAACASQGTLLNGKGAHARIVAGRYAADVVVDTALVTMYGKCGCLEDAWRIFDSMPEQSVVSWTAMISVLVQHKQSAQAFNLFDQMQWKGVMPNKITFACVCLACATQGTLHRGKVFHAQIVKSGFGSDVVVGNALVNMYGKGGSLEDALKVFDRMPHRDVVTWNAIITMSAENGQGHVALQLFERMQREGVTPDKVTFISILAACSSHATLTEVEQVHAHILNTRLESDAAVGNSLINLYGKCGSLEQARRIFDGMSNRNVISWTAMIAALAQHGHGNDALCLFEQMYKESALPNDVTFVNIIVACSHGGLIDDGCHLFVSMIQDHGISPSLDHYVSMVDLLARAGQLEEAERFINNMPALPNAAAFLALLGACRHQVDLHRGEHAAECVFDLDPQDFAAYAILSKLYFSVGRADDAAKTLRRMWRTGPKEW